MRTVTKAKDIREDSAALRDCPPADDGEALVAPPCLSEAYREITELASLEEDWDDEGAPPIDRAGILRAQRFVRRLACALEGRSPSEDGAPMVFPTIESGVKLLWKTDGRRMSLAFQPGQNHAVEVMEKALGEPESRRSVSESEAEEIALRATLRPL